jgi:hypothetical protein
MNRSEDVDARQKAGHDGGEVRWPSFVVPLALSGYIPRMLTTAHRIVLADHARLPWRFFGRLTSVQDGL